VKYFTFKIIPYTGNYSKNNDWLQAKIGKIRQELWAFKPFH